MWCVDFLGVPFRADHSYTIWTNAPFPSKHFKTFVKTIFTIRKFAETSWSSMDSSLIYNYFDVLIKLDFTFLSKSDNSGYPCQRNSAM